jgi:beta-lactamase regulating signal transducer with metallopeptidase domain
VHLFLGVASVLLVLFGGFLPLSLLPRVGAWSRRRALQCLVLSVPIMSLLLGMSVLHHFPECTCLSQALTWNFLLGVALPATMGVAALGALIVGMARLALMAWIVARSGAMADPAFQSFANNLSARLGTPRCRVLLRVYDRPLAFTCGILRPTVLLSTWMVEHLDHRELEAVLVHELEHVARRDYLVIWLATMLRDAFFYIPTSRAAYRQLTHEKEFACDDAVVGTTHRPLALASALAKVLLHAIEEPPLAHYAVVQPLARVEEPVNSRIERLLTPSRSAASACSTSKVGSSLNFPALVGLLILEGVNLSVMLALMGCDPALLFEKLF